MHIKSHKQYCNYTGLCLVYVPYSEFFVFNLGITRSNGLKLCKEHVNTNVRLHCYRNRVINDWNSLPFHIVNASNVLTFKTLIDDHCKNLILYNYLIVWLYKTPFFFKPLIIQLYNYNYTLTPPYYTQPMKHCVMA